MSDIPLDPINRQAAKVFYKGEQVEVRKSETYLHSRDPIPVVTDKLLLASIKEQFDLTGKKRGRLTVIGKARDIKGRWVVRCSCGNYEVRKASALTGEYLPEQAARCVECCIGFKKRHGGDHENNTTLI